MGDKEREKHMNKIVYCPNYGGFKLSEEQRAYLKEKFGVTEEEYLPRHDKRLVEAVEMCEPTRDADIWEIAGNEYRIEEYDGMEIVVEPEDISFIKIES